MEDIIDELQKRAAIVEWSRSRHGTISQHLETPRTLYCGFDPTADSLHVGSLMPLVTMLRFVQRGHRAIVLLGGGTGLIGDPSFKTAERELHDPQLLQDRCASIGQQCRHIFKHFTDRQDPTSADAHKSKNKKKNESKGALCVLDNAAWLGEQKLIHFLRDVGKHFSVNAMVKKDAVATRIERDGYGISFTEFSYMLLQAYDFAQLNQTEACTVQLGGSDQWGNIVAGIDLMRRMHALTPDPTPTPDPNSAPQPSPPHAYGITTPLITRSDGGKFGKTETGTVWLSAQRTSPYAFHQFWLNIQDEDVYRYLYYFSFSPLKELQARETIGRTDVKELLEDKHRLADELTALVHGNAILTAVNRIRNALFVDAVATLSEEDCAQLAADGLDNTAASATTHALPQCLVDCGLARTPRGEVTLGQANKFIKEGAIRVNGVRVVDERTSLTPDNALHGKYHLLRRGKKHFHILVWE